MGASVSNSLDVCGKGPVWCGMEKGICEEPPVQHCIPLSWLLSLVKLEFGGCYSASVMEGYQTE
jgi:hypothetical protein